MSVYAGVSAAGRGSIVGAGSGLISALICLLLVGTKLAPEAGQTGAHPQVALELGGFLLTGLVVGLIGGAIGSALPPRPSRDWLARLALVAAASVMPLVFIGGLVTSTHSGMAVPDWPNTYGSNMFLYPLGPRVGPDVFFEHSHRLFGTLVGLSTLVLMLWILRAETRRGVRIFSVVVFLLVVLQGVLGGVRVRMGSTNPDHDVPILAMAHGILAQVTFGSVVALAVLLSPTYRAATASGQEIAGTRRVKAFATGALHSTLLQLVFGAMYRHFRDSHSMWTHAGFSMVVLIMALLTAFAAGTMPDEPTGSGRIVRRLGKAVLAVVIVQFLLGWATFGMGGSGPKAETPAQALLRTAHQANGGLLLALITATYFWARRLFRVAGPSR